MCRHLICVIAVTQEGVRKIEICNGKQFYMRDAVLAKSCILGDTDVCKFNNSNNLVCNYKSGAVMGYLFW